MLLSLPALRSRVTATSLWYHARAASMSTSTTSSRTPMADTIQAKLTEAFAPIELTLHNDSHRHSHHMAMRSHPAHSGREAGEPETHFRVHVVSAAFEGARAPARHRMVYAALKEELAQEGGVHALQITARTPAEEDSRKKREETGGSEAP